MKKSILTSIIAIAFAMPAVCANIPNDATCNSGVLGVSSGSANLEADYTANTINITWNSNGGSTPTGGASSCTYDTTFNLPTAPTKTGYTFAGWSVRQNCFSSITMSDIMAGMNNATLSYKGLDGSGDGNQTGLNNGDWVAQFDFGTIRGTSKCTKTPNPGNYYGNPDAVTSGEYTYCWCNVASFTPNNSAAACNINTWFYLPSNDSDLDYTQGYCQSDCTGYCANDFSFSIIQNFAEDIYGMKPITRCKDITHSDLCDTWNNGGDCLWDSDNNVCNAECEAISDKESCLIETNCKWDDEQESCEPK